MYELSFRWAAPTLDIYAADVSTDLALPFAAGGIAAGFPSPANDYLDLSIDLNRELVDNPDATFYARVKGDSMQEAGIQSGDVLVVDRSLTAFSNDIVVAFLNGEFTVKRLQLGADTCVLLPANRQYPELRVQEGDDFRIWGVVTYVIKNVREGGRGKWVCMR
ncbi:MAG: translesion error-prone DNA polymerase V autoproteolytic subunit [Chitinophagales bacterium]|jgi:DNA polymerase V|nr:translesion error-prone DNA polymerase V autoproteolytic subunit [Chitinophagales bacterium]